MRRPRSVSLVALAAWLSLAASGCSRLTGLPEVPASVTAASAGLSSLEGYAAEDQRLSSALSYTEKILFASDPPADVVDLARWGMDRVGMGEVERGLELLSSAVAKAPTDLALGNAYRMQVYRLQRKFLSEARARGDRMPQLPAYLASEPAATLKRIAASEPSREIRLQLALAYVDRMALNPALEIKAPASIDSVHALTEILESDPYYVPALVGRGLNHLYRPTKLVWPEHPAPAPDSASKDLLLAAAVGAKVGGVSPRLKGMILVILGDALVHEGKFGVARSWWALARKSTDSPTVREALSLRVQWSDREALDRLEEHLAERMEDLDHPVGDLSFLWNASSKGPS